MRKLYLFVQVRYWRYWGKWGKGGTGYKLQMIKK